jgi:uncharacterized protein YbjT (DUF2867 family)
MKTVLVAGATGYLGQHLLLALHHRGYAVHALARDRNKLADQTGFLQRVIEAQATDSQALTGCCEGVEVVISALGITRQKEGFTYEEVDYGANANLLAEARRAGVQKFLYVSLLDGPALTDLALVRAKERFVDELTASGLDYCILRPSGFFSDVAEVFHMARSGKVYLFGEGTYRANPIHGADLAVVCVDQIEGEALEVPVGGPEVWTQREIAELAFQVLGKRPRISSIPLWLKNALLWTLRKLSGVRTYGPAEFFLTVLTRDMVAPQVGTHRLISFFEALKADDKGRK